MMAKIDEETKKSVIPKVIEPTFGMERIFLAIIVAAYTFDEKRQRHLYVFGGNI